MLENQGHSEIDKSPNEEKLLFSVTLRVDESSKAAIIAENRSLRLKIGYKGRVT
jgi:hypothetical protein